MNRVFKLKGKRAGLAVLEKQDLDLCFRWINDLEVSVYLTGFERVFSRESEDEWYNKVHNNPEEQVLAIIDLKNGKYIGNTELKIDLKNRQATLGIMIGEKSCWNKGYGSEALVLMLDYGFNVLSLNRINLFVYDFNKRALHVYEKVGFKKVGIEREARLVAGKFHDVWHLDMLAAEFRTYYKSLVRI